MIAVLLVTRLAVFGGGADPSATGTLVHAIEARIADHPTLFLKPDADVISIVGRRAATPDAAARSRAAELWNAATRAYYMEHLDDARDKLDQLAPLCEHAPAAERARLALWRSAVFLGSGDRERATAEARAALALFPSLQIDLNVFRPSVARFIDEVRTATPIADAIPLDPAIERAALGAVAHGEISTDERRLFERVSEALHVDALLIGATRGDPATDVRAALWWRGGLTIQVSPVEPASADGMLALSEWAAGHLLAGRPVDPIALPRRPTTTLSGAPSGLTLRAGLVLGSRDHVVSGGPSSYASVFGGTGPHVGAAFAHDRFLAEGDVSWIRWSLRQFKVRLADGSVQTVDGGESSHASAKAGWRISDEFSAFAGLFAEQILNPDLHGGGRDLGIFADQRRFGALLLIRGEIPHFSVDLGVVPASIWREIPDNTSGHAPVGEILPFARVGGELPIRLGWTGRVDWSAELRGARFRGDGEAPLNPPLHDARVRELYQTVSVSFGRNF